MISFTNTTVSRVALGTMQFLWTVTKQEAYNILDAYVEAGGNCIDTADMYPNWVKGFHGGEVETIIGNWIKKKGNREKIFLITKVRSKMWESEDGEGLNKKHIIKACEQSLQRLQTDHIDVYLSHWSDSDTPIEETLSAYKSLITQGKVRFIGCSNYSKEELRKALRVGRELGTSYTFLEVYYNLIDRKNFEQNILPLVRKYNLTVLFYGPLASGFLTGSYRKNKPLPENTRASFVKEKMTEQNLQVINCLDKMAKRYKKTVAQIALAWLLHKDYITAPIIGVDSLKQLKENLGAIDVTLYKKDIEILNSRTSYE